MRIVAVILAVFYLAVSSGFPLYQHYCMGKYDGWGIGYSAASSDGNCDHCRMTHSTRNRLCTQEKSGCCNNKVKVVKLEEDQKLTDFTYPDFKKPLEAVIQHKEFIPVTVLSLSRRNPTSHAPPLQIAKEPLFVRNCVFRI